MNCYFFFLLFISCNLLNVDSNHFYYQNPLNIIDVSDDKFYNDFVIKMSENPDNYKVYLTDSNISSQIIKKTKYYNLYNISKVRVKNKNLDVRLLYGEYDYYSDIILVSIKDNRIIDFNIVSSSVGDGGDFRFIKSIAYENEFKTKHIRGKNLFSKNVDTFYIDLLLETTLKILNNGKFKIDTISKKENYTILESNNFDLSKNF